ncbi:MAG TPA: tetratricopeptide repeat protein, partial [Tahibacter sp.]|nr:tetratricopeptide repeat protein [Tahibacter sp.]
MAFDQLDEHEQSEIVRKWMRDNVASIFVGIGLGLLVIFGYFQWQGHQARQRVMAANEFMSFGAAVGAKNETAAKATLERIQKDYSGNVYAVIAAMRWAEGAIARKDLAAAEQSLQWAYDHAGNNAVKSLAGQNLVRVKLGADKAAEALTLIDSLPVEGPLQGLLGRGEILARDRTFGPAHRGDHGIDVAGVVLLYALERGLGGRFVLGADRGTEAHEFIR